MPKIKLHYVISLNIIIVFLTLITITFLGHHKVSAISSSDFSPGYIVSDGVFTNKSALSASQIQTFLNSKIASCDTGGLQNSEMNNSGVPDYNNNGSIQRWEWGKYRYNQTVFTCLKDYSEGGKTSAQIIYDTAQEFSINPQVLVVLLQKEQALVTDTWPISVQYRSATGYGCPDTADCNVDYYGFTNQVRWSATMFRAIMNDSPTWYTPYELGVNYIQYNPTSSCGGSNVDIKNRSTQALYNYTPYQPNSATLAWKFDGAAYPGCGAFGNLNFFVYFTDWFGTTYDTVYNGVDYSSVFDPTYYLNKYPDLKTAFNNNPTAALSHFVNYGMNEGRQGIDNFDVASYKNRYQDLRRAFGGNLRLYYIHYMTKGKAEGRLATGVVTPTYITDYNGVDYSLTYNYLTYMTNYSDLNKAYGNDDFAALIHFVKSGMKEGRQAVASFSVKSYLDRYPDLRYAFGTDLKSYYIHFIKSGKAEGRIATGSVFNGASMLNGVDYSSVYSFSPYVSRYADLMTAFGNNDINAITHFVYTGMKEGRQASDSFSVQTYRSNYSDLRAAFGTDLKAYYLHYIYDGKKEGRVAV